MSPTPEPIEIIGTPEPLTEGRRARYLKLAGDAFAEAGPVDYDTAQDLCNGIFAMADTIERLEGEREAFHAHLAAVLSAVPGCLSPWSEECGVCAICDAHGLLDLAALEEGK